MSNETNNTANDPWVESGAMVYVALTVATCSAVIMCCTWFVTHNSEALRWWKGDHYGVVNEEENIELQAAEESDEEEVIFDSGTKFKDIRSDAFTLDDSPEELDDSPEESEDEENTYDDRHSAV
tara:strand:- start:24416 stop:24787 length:372 start_codon:yes stop_codon:yes gene_type:complete